jgi:hypothetical protein
MSDRDILLGIRDEVSTTLDMSAQIDVLGKEDSVSVQQLPGAKWRKQYVTGGGIRQYPFAVLVRLSPKDTAARLNAYEGLMSLPYEMTALPSLVERADNGTEVWRAAYTDERVVESV